MNMCENAGHTLYRYYLCLNCHKAKINMSSLGSTYKGNNRKRAVMVQKRLPVHTIKTQRIISKLHYSLMELKLLPM